MQSAKSGVSRVLGLPAKLIGMPEADIRGCYVLTVTQVSFTLLMTVVPMVIPLSTRGTADSDNLFLRLSDQALPRSYHLLDSG